MGGKGRNGGREGWEGKGRKGGKEGWGERVGRKGGREGWEGRVGAGTWCLARDLR